MEFWECFGKMKIFLCPIHEASTWIRLQLRVRFRVLIWLNVNWSGISSIPVWCYCRLWISLSSPDPLGEEGDYPNFFPAIARVGAQGFQMTGAWFWCNGVLCAFCLLPWNLVEWLILTCWALSRDGVNLFCWWNTVTAIFGKGLFP